MDPLKLSDLQNSLVNLRKELGLIKKHLFTCYLQADKMWIPFESAQEYFSVFLTPEDISKKLKKDKNDKVLFSDLIDTLEKGFSYVENYQRPYTRFMPRGHMV